MIRLPPEITFKKRPLPDGGWCYDFHHCALGALGRVLLHAMPDGRNTRITCELAEANGDPAHPITIQRRAIFEPLGLEISEQMGQVALAIAECHEA
ncbi:MAG: hypothetical protein ACLP7P_09660 [Rhodomicrobium sp.]